MESNRINLVPVLLVAVLLLGCDGRDTTSSQGGAAALPMPGARMRRGAGTGYFQESDAIAWVKQQDVKGEGVTAEEWVEIQLDHVEGQVMFPFWDARRRGADKYEVRFTYTVLYDDYRIEKQGFAWHVNPVLELIGPPQKLIPEDLSRLREPSRPSLLITPTNTQPE